MGRFMSPDWSAKEEPVPYAKLDDPQTLNLYGYVGNNPLSRRDADGHQCDVCAKFINAVKNTIRFSGSAGSGVEASGSIGGVKVTAGASTKTTVTKTPFGSAPTTVESSIEKGLKVQVGTKTGEIVQKTPIGEGKDSVEVKGGASGPHLDAGLSTGGSIPVVGISLGIGPVLVGGEVSISSGDASTAIKTAFPAFEGAVKEMMGNTLNTPGPGGSSTLFDQARDYISSH
jgi:hypothetical protein